MATRLFKYLINDYYEEFCTNVTDWVSAGLTLVEHEEADRTLLDRGQEADRTLLGRGQDIQKLQELYTKHVIPDTMVELWNNGAGHLSHKLPPDVEASASRSRLVSRFTTFIVKYLLTPDEHPTLTRFFTFRKVIDAMLTMDIIAGLPQNLLKLVKIKPREENQKRQKKVVGFFSNPTARQALRRSSLVPQLTG